jgi:hypothetical protein
VSVVGTYVNLDGSAAAGTVTFTPNTAAGTFFKDTGADVIILPVKFSATLDANGHLSITLPATDDPDESPNGWTYTVTESFATGQRTYSIAVPSSSGTLDLVNAAPTQSVTASVVMVASVNGVRPDNTGALTLTATNIGALAVVSAPTGTASTDTAAVQTAINLATAAGGGTVRLQAGTYVVNGLTMYSNIALEGVSPGATIIQLANSANTDVIQGANFTSLTLTGSITGGIGGFVLRDFTIDGNKANNTSGYGLRLYGYDFDIERVHIRNCAGDGMYTEWGNFGGPSLPDKSMEARYKSLKIHDNNGWGWHNRGPHDSVADSIIWWNNTGGNYWNEGIPTSTVIAAGSNGAALPQATINVNSTVGYNAAGGTITVATSGGTQTVTYTGLTATSFTGCSGGTGTMSTGGVVGWQNGGYSSSGMLMSNCHAWSGSAPVAVQIDGSNCKLVNFVAEGATTTQILVRANDVIISGGSIFYGTGSNAGNGLVIGDTNNPVAGSFIRSKFGGFQGTSSATAAIYLANDYGNNDLDCFVYQPTGSAYFGTPASAGTRLHIQSSGASRPTNAANSKNQWAGPTRIDGSGASAFVVNDGTNDHFNINATSSRVELPGGRLLRFYASGYGSNSLDIDGVTGHIIPKGTAPTVAGIGGSGNFSAVSVVGGSSDMSGEVQVTAGTAPVAGNLFVVTFASAWPAAPRIMLTPKNAASATCQAYIAATSTATFTVAVVNASAASASLDWFYHVLA